LKIFIESTNIFSHIYYTFCEFFVILKYMLSVENKIVKRVYANHRGWSFSKTDFLDLANDDSIRQALRTLECKGTIRRVIRGLYDYPRISKLINGPMGPDLIQVVNALARKSGWRIQPAENTALNLLGLSTQIPADLVYLSDGPNKTFWIGKRKIVFKKCSLKEAGFTYKESELVVQALKALGENRVSKEVEKKVSSAIPQSKWKKILRDTKTAPAWVSKIILSITKEYKTV